MCMKTAVSSTIAVAQVQFPLQFSINTTKIQKKSRISLIVFSSRLLFPSLKSPTVSVRIFYKNILTSSNISPHATQRGPHHTQTPLSFRVCACVRVCVCVGVGV